MINLVLTIQEVEAILIHLGKGQYSDVAMLIEKIKGQAIPQVNKIQELQQKAQNQVNAVKDNPQTQADIDEAQANSDSMRNE